MHAAAAPYVGHHTRQYTSDNPLIYEDAWEKWPYAFVNDDGEPDGFNVELVKRITKRLGIPCTIVLKEQKQVHEDMRKNNADLTFGVNAGYNASYGHFGRVCVTTFDNALAQPRTDSIGPYKLIDLKDMPFTVKDNSRAYYYVKEYGFSDSLVTCIEDMPGEVLRMASDNQGAVLWNAMMLKWMVNKYHLTNIAISAVDIPSGKYSFMSGDTILLNKFDSVCTIMIEDGTLEEMQQRWMYPEEAQEDNTHIYILIITFLVIAITVAVLYTIHFYRRHYTRTTLSDLNSQMELVLEANDMQVWVYYPLTRRYAWMTRDGRVNRDYSSFDFSQFYPEQDFNIIHAQVMELLNNDQGPVVRTLRSYALHTPGRVLDVEVQMQTLRDEYGKIYLVCGVQHDITDSKAYLDRMRLLHEKYKVAYNIAPGALLRFDGSGTLVDINDKFCQKMGIANKEDVIRRHYTIADFGILNGIDINTMPNDLRFSVMGDNDEMEKYVPMAHKETFNPDPMVHPDGYTEEERQRGLGKVADKGYNYIHLVKSTAKDGRPLSLMMFMKDITASVQEQKRLKHMQRQTTLIDMEKEKYLSRRNYTLRAHDILMVRYNPEEKMLTIYDRVTGEKHILSQLRALEIVDGKDMKKVFKAYHKVDAKEENDIHINVATILRNEDGEQKHYSIDIRPVHNKQGEVTGYFGICRDITRQLTTQRRLKKETKRAREAENLRQTFLKNMSYTIRQPLVAMRESIRLLSEAKDPVREQTLLTSITDNTQRLMTLSDDTLLLSKVEAGLFVQHPEPLDFVELYTATVNAVIDEYRRDTVTYKVESIYDTLPLMIDKDVIARILREVVGLSARYTLFGTIVVRYIYRKGMLTIAVEDTGPGIPPTEQASLFEPHLTTVYGDGVQHRLSGLEMPICKALVDMLHGTIEIDSDPGKGTSLYVVIKA